MENGIDMNEKKKAKTKLMLFICALMILLILGAIISGLSEFKGSFPLGRLISICSPFILFSFIFVLNVKNTSESSSKKIVMFLIIGIIFIAYGKTAINAIYDLVKGPQEIVLEDAETYKVIRTGYRSRGTRYYLSGKTEDGTTVKIAMTKDKFEEMSAIINETDPITISYYKGLNEFYDLGSRPQKFVLEDARPVKAVNRNDETICYLTGKKEDGTTVKIAISHDKFEEIKEVTKKNDTIIVHYLLGSDGFFEIEVVE